MVSDSSFPSVEGKRRDSTCSTFSERKYSAEERDFTLAKQFLFEEDPIARERRRWAKERATVTAWCKKNGYQDLITPKRTYRGTRKFALHTAVKHQDAHMVRLLIKCGATKDARDSSGMTALQLAEMMVEGDTRNQITDALCM